MIQEEADAVATIVILLVVTGSPMRERVQNPSD